jgi:hypothetical protein
MNQRAIPLILAAMVAIPVLIQIGVPVDLMIRNS